MGHRGQRKPTPKARPDAEHGICLSMSLGIVCDPDSFDFQALQRHSAPHRLGLTDPCHLSVVVGHCDDFLCSLVTEFSTFLREERRSPRRLCIPCCPWLTHVPLSTKMHPQATSIQQNLPDYTGRWRGLHPRLKASFLPGQRSSCFRFQDLVVSEGRADSIGARQDPFG